MRGRIEGPRVRALRLLHVMGGNRSLPVMAAVDPGVAAAHGHVSWWPAFGLEASVEWVARCPALDDGILVRSRDAERLLASLRAQVARELGRPAGPARHGGADADVRTEARRRLDAIEWTRCVVIWVRY